MSKGENRLPKSILAKATKYRNEFGCKKADFIEVVEAARQVPMGIVGGQVIYYLPDGTCELYWLSYDPRPQQPDENWLTYCDRSAKECIEKFNTLITTIDIEKDAVESFNFIEEQKRNGIDISKYQIFLLYFNDKESG